MKQLILFTSPNDDKNRQITTFLSTYTLTYKSKGLMSREEYNLPLTAESYEHLKKKADGNVIRKKRYCIPFSDALTIELDLFDAPSFVFLVLIIHRIYAVSHKESGKFVDNLKKSCYNER